MLLSIVKKSNKKIPAEVLPGKNPCISNKGEKIPAKSAPTPLPEKITFLTVKGPSLKNGYNLQHYQVIWLDIR